MRRYGIARYLTAEQRARAARAVYERVPSRNTCRRGCCHAGTMLSTRSAEYRWLCPLGVALDLHVSPDAWEAESELSSGVSGRVNHRRLKAVQRFIHDIDSGKIGPNDVGAALGVEVTP